MARPKSSLADRVASRSHREDTHLIWDGPTYRGKPHLHNFGNPARVLLNLVDQPRISIKTECHEPMCIEPRHWRVIIERDHKYLDIPKPVWRYPRDDSAVQFSDQELEEIDYYVQEGTTTEDELKAAGCYSAEFIAEVLTRIAARATT